MNHHVSKRIVLSAFFIALFLLGSTARATEVECRMNFTLKSWSFFYKSGKGTGTITCNNGQSARVYLRGEGGGLTVGKSKIVNGLGVFSDVSSIKEVFGNYANGEAHAGAGGSASARVLTKGDVSLTLTGTGEGVDLGINFGNFKISKR
jgi:hypothetical protein